jgi:shikimate kinase/3-dehydroquinate synthase
MFLFLYGPSGSGKSTTGKLLAESLNIQFLDLDAEIENITGQTISRFMDEKGEAAFREAEKRVLHKSINNAEKVIALGGGTLLDDDNRTLVKSKGPVIFLDADPSILTARLAQDANQRPLLDGELETSLKLLLEKREAHYNSFPLRVDASRQPDQVVRDIQRCLGRYHLRTMPPGYDVLVQEGGLDSLGEMLRLRGFGETVLVVCDRNVAPLYAERVTASVKSARFTASKVIIPAGEAHKTIETVSSLWRACLQGAIDRKSTIIALGGGVVGDLAGFTAATFMRGCRWIALPTTLLAMVDASIGGKTGFDLPEGKNLVGAFYPPGFVLADPDVLHTLPVRELRAGLAEVIKHGVIADPELFHLCAEGWNSVTSKLPDVVRRGAAVKVVVIEEDPYEQGFRAALNFGHTVGHAVELVSGFRMAHGEAVAVGMVAEARLAERLSIADTGLADKLVAALSGLGLPVEISQDLPRSEIVSAMKVDKKKSRGIVRFALPVKIGEVKVGVEVDNLESVLEEEK